MPSASRFWFLGEERKVVSRDRLLAYESCLALEAEATSIFELHLHIPPHNNINFPGNTNTSMLPPIEPETASSNPKFDALYRDLSSNKLNADGTTKVDANAQKERDAFSEVCFQT